MYKSVFVTACARVFVYIFAILNNRIGYPLEPAKRSLTPVDWATFPLSLGMTAHVINAFVLAVMLADSISALHVP